MKIFRSLTDIPSDFGPVVATIGNFDGVHCGHRWVIDRVNARAQELGLRSLALTFDPHPVRVLRPEAAHSLITPLESKLDQLATTGIDATLVLPFNLEISRLTPEAFARQILRDAMHVREVHEGENFRFGYQAAADMQGLAELGAQLGFAVHAYSPYIVRGSAISSSRIRNLIAAGDVSHARALLGRPFQLLSTPASGRGYGTRYAVPTINLAPYPELLPGNGVYVTQVMFGEGAAHERFHAVTNVGNRPTFGVDSFAVESHLLDFHPVALAEDTPVAVRFLARLRAERRWPSPEALRAQIMQDVRDAARYFSLAEALASKDQPQAAQQV